MSTSYRPVSAGPSEPWIRFAEVSRADTDVLSVVIGSPLTFLEASHYAPQQLRDRLVQLVVSADKGNRLLAQFIPLKFEDLASFQVEHSRFILCSVGFGDVMTQYFLDKRYRLTLLAEYGGHPFYVAEPR